MNKSFHYMSLAVHSFIQKQLNEQIKELGLTSGQPKVLEYLYYHDGVSQKEIAKGCFIEAGSLTSLLNRMEEMKYVERRIVNGNRRTFYVFLTELGKKKADCVVNLFSQMENQWFSSFNEEEKEHLVKGMSQLYHIMLEGE